MLLLPLKMLQFPDEADHEHLQQSKQIWESQSGHLRRMDEFNPFFWPMQVPICATRLHQLMQEQTMISYLKQDW